MRKTLSCFCLAAATLTSNGVLAAVSRADYDALIRNARTGDYEPALIMLREHSIDHPRDLRAAYDHILIAGWAKRSEEVVTAYEAVQPRPNRLPQDVLNSVAQAYRDTQQWDNALMLYREGQKRYPRQTAFSVGEIMVLADAGRPEEAVSLGREWIAKKPENPDLRLALSYAYRSSAAPFAVLQETDQARNLAPNKAYVTREYLDSLKHAGLAYAAFESAKLHPELIPPERLRDLQADYLAQLARLAGEPTRQEAERFAIADSVIAEYDRLIPDWQALGPEADKQVLRLQVDRLQALHIRKRMKELVDEYETLVAQGATLPNYIRNDVAAAYLYLRQPEKARDLYRQVLADTDLKAVSAGEHLSNQTGLFYSLIESEQFDDASQVIEAAQVEQPRWRYIKGLVERVPNELYLYSEQTAALSLFYVDDTVAAQHRLEEMVNHAPRNVGLRTALANVYRGRSWPRRAEKELKMAEALEARAVEVEAGQGLTAMQLQEWAQARSLSLDLAARFPEEKATDTLAREWAVHNKAELRVTGERGIASDSPVSGSGDLKIDTVLYSAPIKDNLRVFGGGGYATGEFEEGTGHYRWLRTGVEWRSRGLTTELEASMHRYGSGTQPGARVSTAYDINDHWMVGGSAEWRSRDTPLRALRSDITSNTVSAFVRWRANERREWSFAYSPSRFSDGNDRQYAIVNGRERLYTSPKIKADLHLTVATMHNSEEDAPYFNPRADLEIMPSLNLTHVLHRKYETVWEQNFLVGAGVYAQRGHGTGGILALGYGMRYQFSEAFQIGANITGISRPYDGVREREARVMFEMTFRF
ncbi:MAG TPA: poly-beta-1,6 N-acetyl-D-glucosamine export porin PgaA [Candidimonas sp.]|nr:poly-beta-1,6 N-acetyl-D-glucosamine export porin PgaA [Candidimonas sp.]